MMAPLEHWCSLHADEWLAWGSLGALAKCSVGLKRAVCHGGAQTVLDLSEGRLAWRKGALRPSELLDLQPVDDSETGNENLRDRIGLYLSESPVGRQLFKPEIFHLWPSPAVYIAGSLGREDFCLRLFKVPASCVQDDFNTWMTTTQVIYAQDGYYPQYLWKGVLELTTPSDWRREPKGVRLTLHLNHNLDYAVGNNDGYGGRRGMHLRDVLMMFSLPRCLLGVLALYDTPPMPIRAGSESQLRRYCLDRYRDVFVERNTLVHNFTRLALQDANFPWSGNFRGIYTYMCKSRASDEDISLFESVWEAAGLTPMAFCRDCKVFVDKQELFNWRHEETEDEEEEKVGQGRRPHVTTYGCWVDECSPDAILGYSYFGGKDPLTFENVYGKSAETFFRLKTMDKATPHKCDRRSAVWQYCTYTNSWLLHCEGHEEEGRVRWRKTCGGMTTVSEHRHFPHRCENSAAVNPDP